MAEVRAFRQALDLASWLAHDLDQAIERIAPISPGVLVASRVNRVDLPTGDH